MIKQGQRHIFHLHIILADFRSRRRHHYILAIAVYGCKVRNYLDPPVLILNLIPGRRGFHLGNQLFTRNFFLGLPRFLRPGSTPRENQ